MRLTLMTLRQSRCKIVRGEQSSRGATHVYTHKNCLHGALQRSQKAEWYILKSNCIHLPAGTTAVIAVYTSTSTCCWNIWWSWYFTCTCSIGRALFTITIHTMSTMSLYSLWFKECPYFTYGTYSQLLNQPSKKTCAQNLLVVSSPAVFFKRFFLWQVNMNGLW